MKKIIFLSILCMITFLSACSFGETTEKKLSNILTEIYDSEKEYRDVQVNIAELEIKEQSSFLSMMELTQEQKENLVPLVEQTASLLDERLLLVERESASIKQASEKVSNLETLISETKEEAVQAELLKIKEALQSRYTTYEDVKKEYTILANLQKELYNTLVEENIEVSLIQEKVKKVNKQNEIVQKNVQQFNDLTTQLNQVKSEVFSSIKQENN